MPGSSRRVEWGPRSAASSARLAVALVISVVAHAILVGSAIAQRLLAVPGTAIASTIVLVDLPPTADPVADGPLVVPVGRRPEAAPSASELARRVESLTGENADLTSALAEERRRTAQLEAEYRREIAAFKSAASDLGREAAALAADNEALAARVEAGRARTVALEEELARRREAEEAALAEMQRTHDRLVAALRQEIADKDVALDAANRRLTVSIMERVLFPSGQATLTPEGAPIVDRIGAVLAGLPDSFVLVEGHTDNVPIGPELRPRYPSNWELSTARAAEVVRRMIEHANVDADRLRAAGRADTKPVADNATEDGRRRNRRIEVILLPLGTAADAAS